MARWRLIQKHYLNVVGSTYEYRETTSAGRQVKKAYPVPMFLDPEDPADRNYPDELIVAHEGSGHDKDIIFTGSPTLDMVPLDDEARKISAEMEIKWGQSYVTSDDEAGYTGRLLEELTSTLTSFNATARPSSPAADTELAELKGQFKLLMDMNTALMAKLQPADRRA